MSYYRGDYYRGDYYRGDPFIGGLLGIAGRAAVGLGRTVARRAAGAARALAGMRPAQAARTLGREVVLPTAVATITSRAVTGGVPAVMPGGGEEVFPEIPSMMPGAKGQCPPGYHLNKADSMRGPKGTYCVKNRKMNPLNPRALKRALRRSEDFEGIARRTVNALRTGPRKFKKISAMGSR